MMCKCNNCGAVYKASNFRAVFMVLTGGAECPNCKTEDGICKIVETKS